MIALLDEVLESVDAARHAAIEAVRKFLSTLEESTPAHVDPSRRKTALDAAMDLADKLSSALMELLRSIKRSASEALSSKPGGTKE